MLQQITDRYSPVVSQGHPSWPVWPTAGLSIPHLNDLQHSVMKVRWYRSSNFSGASPDGNATFRGCGKQAELAVSGQDTDLDKSCWTLSLNRSHIWCAMPCSRIERREEAMRLKKAACGDRSSGGLPRGQSVAWRLAMTGAALICRR